MDAPGRELSSAVAPRLQPSQMEAVDVKGMVLVLIAVAVLAFAAGARPYTTACNLFTVAIRR